MELSDERKRQIREEEQARLRAEQEAEEQYREQVRRELEQGCQADVEQSYREEVRDELAASAPSQVEAVVAPPPVQTAPAKPPSQKSRAFSFHSRLVAIALIVGGVSAAGVAFSRGFALPFIGQPSEITLKAESSGDFESVGEIPEETTSAAATVSTSKAAPSAKPAAVKVTTETTPKKPVSTPAPTAARGTLAGTSTSIEVPSGWKVEPGDPDSPLEIRWHGSGVASGRQEVVAYLLLQNADMKRGEALEHFAERLLKEFLASTTPDDAIALKDDKLIRDFHGVQALSIGVFSKGFMPYQMRNYYFIKGGKGYMLTCYATAGSFDDRLPAFDRMIKSMRFTK